MDFLRIINYVEVFSQDRNRHHQIDISTLLKFTFTFYKMVKTLAVFGATGQQ